MLPRRMNLRNKMKSDSRLNALRIELHGQPIGVLNRLGGGQHFFAFEQQYLDSPGRSTLSLSYKGVSGGVAMPVRPTSTRLPAFFSNLLPEGRLRQSLAEQAGIDPAREFALLAFLGTDLPGAVTAGPFPNSVPHPEPDREPPPGALRFSLAGVQLKLSAIMEASGGLGIPAQGIGGDWIVKLPSLQFPAVAENEFVMLELARSIGIPVPEILLAPVSSIHGLPPEAARLAGQALAVRRFDRGAGAARIHMEDFAQVFAIFPEDKYRRRSYANIAAVLQAETGEAGAQDFVRRLAFSVSIGNGDMHLKNWSLLYPDGRTPTLSPAYDFISTLPYIPEDQLALTFGGRRSFEGISLDQVRHFADKANMAVSTVWNNVREVVERTADAWRGLAQKEILPAFLRDVIGRQIERVAANTSGRR